MPSLEEAREQAWRDEIERSPSQTTIETSWRRAGFNAAWSTRGQFDEQRIAALGAALAFIADWCEQYGVSGEAQVTMIRERAERALAGQTEDAS